MIREAKRLSGLGLSIHWVRPNSKAPIEAGWSKVAKKTPAELEDTYRYGFNLGVRLGEPGVLPDGTFLAAVDCDLKSSDPRHLKEMLAKLGTLLKVPAPEVRSGRGNGSRHYYVKTKAPVNTYRFGQSSEKVRVQMPSAKPSKADEAEFLRAEINEGWRLRAAWEISIMGTGGQVVLPPSIHPDTGKSYEWAKPIERLADLPLVELGGGKRDEAPAAVVQDFAFVVVNLVASDLSDKTVDLILSGTGCDDRSAGLFSAAIAMVKAGMSDAEILSVLTDRDTFLGGAAYDHAQTTSRKRAAEWVRKYTLVKARREFSAESEFSGAAVVETLDAAGTAAQAAEMASGDWRDRLEKTGTGADARIRNTLKNVYTILVNETADEIFSYDEFSGGDFYTDDTPWDGVKGREVVDMDTVRIKSWLAEHYRVEPSDDRIEQAVGLIADRNRRHPVREYLGELAWDGTPRLDTWLKDYLGAVGPDEYLAAVGRKTLCALVARVMDPGCKFDQVLILEGKQGCGKSTAVRMLADPWFSDSHINVGDKDAVLTMRSVWVLELGELSGMRKADADMLKAFVSQRVDRIRKPYGKRAEDFPRQCVFIGTTNSNEYLKDTSGNRRYWPVAVTQCQFKKLKQDRDQLLAEAKFGYEMGEPLYLETPELVALAQEEQDTRTLQDSWSDLMREYFDSPHENFPKIFTIHDMFKPFGPLAGMRDDRGNQMRASDVLRTLGFIKNKRRIGKNKFARVWWQPEVATNQEVATKNPNDF